MRTTSVDVIYGNDKTTYLLAYSTCSTIEWNQLWASYSVGIFKIHIYMKTI